MMRFEKVRKSGQAGQSLVILAFAFVALMGFVGIVTDVSLLFVRYSTLSRAVDSAAVAAATQMRRIEDEIPDDNVDTGPAQNIANMNLAARQFLVMYGLDPEEVIVETCQSQMVDFVDTDGSGPLSPAPVFNCVVIGGKQVYTPEEQEERYHALCRDQRKLVRVTATIMSPTVFLRLLGIQDIRLTVEALSETAVLDVVLVMDVSESMLDETTYDSWNGIAGVGGQTPTVAVRFLPGHGPRNISSQEELNWWQSMLRMSQRQINSFVQANPTQVVNGTNYYLAPRAFIPGVGEINAWNDPRLPREECRVRFWPNAHNISFGSMMTEDLLGEYRTFLSYAGISERAYFNLPADASTNPEDSRAEPYYRFSGWVPTYDYYGCCNDPNGDRLFDDLVCEPFRQARESSDKFLERIDFARGDRVGFVTFSRTAHPIDPDGEGEMEWMIDNEDLAREVLQDVIGVRAEPSFYADETGPDGVPDGRWDSYVIRYNEESGAPVTVPYRYGGTNDISYWADTSMGEITNTHPVRNNCAFDTAALFSPFTVFNNQDGSSDPILYGMQQPDWLSGRYSNRSLVARYSYDYRGSCRDTNVGGALARAGEVFEDNGRREGAVWVMVLLSDGAAGASDPVTRGGQRMRPTDPYQFQTVGSYVVPTRQGAGQYGAFGVCPHGANSNNPAELVLNGSFPYCSDTKPETRHFCTSPDATLNRPRNTPLALDLNNNEFLCQYYDVDDYARDWADLIGGATEENINARQLPIIFTIGFGLDYPERRYFSSTNFEIVCADEDENCIQEANLEMYLGEELLRYIADVGDNFRIDDDYWQSVLGGAKILADPNELGVTDTERAAIYGQRGSCEEPDGTPGEFAPLPIMQDCGNYFNATGGTQLDEVFNEIASRMFTRLSQ